MATRRATRARAIDGVALMVTPDADALMLNTISTTQATLVRARAVRSYLRVHGDAGRATVAALLPPEQQIFLDRIDVLRVAQSYNDQLAAFLAKHPEVIPPSS